MPHSLKLSFTKGDQIEVIKQQNGRVSTTYYPAIVIKPVLGKQKDLLIEYQTLTLYYPNGDNTRLREIVEMKYVRPMPPRDVDEGFTVGDSVDVYCDHGWQRGTVKDILENSEFVVGFDGKSDGILIDQCNLRVHREFKDDGSWFPPLCRKRKVSNLEDKRKRVKLDTDYKKKFTKGMVVEVKADEEGYQGAWYGATIVDSVVNDKFIVQYLNLLTDDETGPLREVVVARNIRPFPPQVPSVGIFELYDEVDAWFNDGWWEGVVSKVLSGFKYMVYFSTTHENLEFEQSAMRFHQEWIDDRWFEGNIIKAEMSRCSSEEKFRRGINVEIRTDEAGYEDAWFAATVFNEISDDAYLVQHLNILTDDESGFLIEEANVSNIRPSPPEIHRAYPFEMFELVDAWYNDAWWVGRVSNVLKIQNKYKYEVRFKTTEILEFDHQELRPHQEWIGGNWFILSLS